MPRLQSQVFKHIKYTIKGEDFKGDYWKERRYKEFRALRKRLRL
jgi:hypothetical protein